jgi:hypothetical protein
MSDSIAPEWAAGGAVIDYDSAVSEGRVLMIMPEAGELLTPAMAIDGFRLGCLIDASTGMVLASLENSAAVNPLTAAAGAADIVNVLTLLSGKLATGEILEDVMITFSDSFFMVHPVGRDPEPRILLLVVADRHRTNLALAHRSLRDLCASFAS